MKTKDNSHVPFAQLKPEEQLLYRLATKVAVLFLQPCLAAIEVAGEEIRIDRVWDEYKFARTDVVDFFDNPKRLEPFLVHFAVKDPDFWCPRLDARRSPRRSRR